MIQPGKETQSPGPLANSLLIRPKTAKKFSHDRIESINRKEKREKPADRFRPRSTELNQRKYHVEEKKELFMMGKIFELETNYKVLADIPSI